MAISLNQAANQQFILLNQHRIEMAKFIRPSEQQTLNLLMGLKGESNADIAMTIRKTFPTLIEQWGQGAANLGMNSYSIQRELLQASTVGGKVKPFSLTELLLGDTKTRIIDEGIDNTMFHMSKFFNGEYNTISQTVKPIQMSASKAIYDFDREVVKINAEKDDAAEGTERSVNSNGCLFCKTMLFHTGEADYHQGCKCTEGPAWKFTTLPKPEWAEETGELYARAQQAIMDHNDAEPDEKKHLKVRPREIQKQMRKLIAEDKKKTKSDIIE